MILGIDASRANHDQKTGVEWYAYHVIQELKHIIPDTDRVVLYSDEPLRGPLAELPSHWKSRVLSWPPRRLWTQVRMSWEMLRRPPDVLFVPAHVVPVIHPPKTVMTVHDVAARQFRESFSWFERWYSLASARYAVNRLWRVIVPSAFTRQELLDEAGRDLSMESNIVVVPLGYDTDFGKKQPTDRVTDVLRQHHITRPFFLCLGRLENKKNTANIIRAFDMLRSNAETAYDLVLVGKPGYGYAEVEAALRNSRVQDHIRVLGWLPKDDVVSLMQAAKLFLFPTRYEGFGIPVLEAMAAGTPVIAARGSSVESMAGDAVEYADDWSAEAIAAAMRRVIRDDSRARELSAAGQKHVQRFSWRETALGTWHALERP